jgi:hypothetical protein
MFSSSVHCNICLLACGNFVSVINECQVQYHVKIHLADVSTQLGVFHSDHVKLRLP